MRATFEAKPALSEIFSKLFKPKYKVLSKSSKGKNSQVDWTISKDPQISATLVSPASRTQKATILRGSSRSVGNVEGRGLFAAKDTVLGGASTHNSAESLPGAKQGRVLTDPPPRKVIKITTIVEAAGERRRRDAPARGEGARRTKRSTRIARAAGGPIDRKRKKAPPPQESKPAKNQSSALETYYRHPKLSYEEQRRQQGNAQATSDKYTVRTPNLNPGTELYKRIWDIINDTNTKFRIVVPPTKRTTPYDYSPALPKCDDKAENATGGGSKLALPDTKSVQSSLELPKVVYKGLLKPEGFQRKAAPSGGTAQHLSPLQGTPTNRNLNLSNKTEGQGEVSAGLQDDQRGKAIVSNSTESSVYDPDKIPYVEVPDYTDLREESLDKEEAGEKLKEHKEKDELGAGLIFNSKRISAKPSGINDSAIPQPGTADVESKAGIVSNANSTYAKDRESLEQLEKFEDRPDFENIEKTENLANEGQDTTEELEEVQEEDYTQDEDPVNFDINEYKKPFVLDEFLKNDPIFKTIDRFKKAKAAKLKKESSQDVPVEEIDGTSEKLDKQSSKRQTAGTRNHDKYEDEYQYEPEETPYTEDHKSRTKIENSGSEETLNRPIADETDDREDILKFMFKADKKEAPAARKGEKDFLERYFVDDVARKLKEDEDDDEDRRESETRHKANVYKTLSTILDRKDDVSRLNADVNDSMKKRKGDPVRYTNFWSLEYGSPRKESDEEEEEPNE
ncbi:hypothetical protein KM043_002304 [Ampulex compressa]|nr:hypothetical protein KM043_002304 [Ampulex compressa]